MAFDYINTQEESIVAEGLEGKIIMVYGGNNLGKSGQAANFPSPLFLPLEPNALNARGGIKKLPVHDWATFRDFVDSVYKDKLNYERALQALERELERPAPKDKEAKKEKDERIERLQSKVDSNPYGKLKASTKTLVLDTLTALGKSTEKYVTDQAEVTELGDIGHGKLYKRFENEFYHTINQFFNLGDFTYLILAHEDFRKMGTDDDGEDIMQAVPKGDWKRIVKPVVDRCDIIAYLKSNGVDEHHKVIPSSAILAECNLCFARTKWDNMQLYIKEYSAENLEGIINEAIEEQRASGVKVGTNREQQKSLVENLTQSADDLKVKIGELFNIIYKHDDEDIEGVNVLKYISIVEEFLGVDNKVSEAGQKQVGQLMNILSRTQDLVDTLV
jgi:hypothetical protein